VHSGRCCDVHSLVAIYNAGITSSTGRRKSITKHLNAVGIRTRDGGLWGIGALHKVLTRTTYIGRHRRAERRTTHIAELRKRAAEADAKLNRLYDAIENGIADVSDPLLKERVTGLKSIRDQARADAERAEGALDRARPTITPQTLRTFAS
jgi:Recombinase